MKGKAVALRHNAILLDLALGIPTSVVAADRDMNEGSITRIANDPNNKEVIEYFQEQIMQNRIEQSSAHLAVLHQRIEDRIDSILEAKLSCVDQNDSWPVKDKAATDLLKMYGVGAIEQEPDEHKTPSCVIVVNKGA